MDNRFAGAKGVSYIGNRAEYANDIFSAQTDLLVSQYYDTLLHRPECITEELLQTLEVNGIIFGDDDAAVPQSTDHLCCAIKREPARFQAKAGTIW